MQSPSGPKVYPKVSSIRYFLNWGIGDNNSQVASLPSTGEYAINYSAKTVLFNGLDVGDPNFVLTYLSNSLTTDESAAIPKLAEEALYACMVYAILANREKTDPNLLQRLLIEKIDKLERSKSRLIFTNFSE